MRNWEKKAHVNIINDTWQSSENTFRLTSLNINSLNCHFDDLAVDSCILRSEAIAISENWYNKENCNPANLNGFNGYHVMAGRGKGVSLFLAEHLIMKDEPILVNMEFMQMIKVKFRSPLKLRHVNVILAYRSPAKNNHKQFIAELSKLIPKKGQTIICGDFNIYPNKTDDHYQTLVNTLGALGLAQIIDKPTHIRGNILDHLYVRDFVDPSWQFHHPYYSDHDGICFMGTLQ